MLSTPYPTTISQPADRVRVAQDRKKAATRNDGGDDVDQAVQPDDVSLVAGGGVLEVGQAGHDRRQRRRAR